MKVLSLFSGIGAFEKALTRLEIPFELVNYCEWDKYAAKAYSLIHNVPQGKNLGDITKVNEKELPDFDLMTYGFPCQDISVAGKQKGIIEGETRSGLLYDALRIAKEKKPKIMIAENVKNLVSKKFKPDFEKLLQELDEMGYNNYWKVLNAKHYGIPQNRERVFIISIRKDIDQLKLHDGTPFFSFPKPFDNGLRLKDMLENEVDDKYYLSEKMYDGFIKHKERHQAKGNGFKFEPFKDTNVIAHCLDTREGGRATNNFIYIKENTKKGYVEAIDGDGIRLDHPNGITGRGRIQIQLSPTLTTSGNVGVIELKTEKAYSKVIDEDLEIETWSIRKLTPKECFRLMGFDDKDIDILKESGISDTQLYKMAGNSIVVNVLEEIFKNLKGSF